MTGRSTHTAEFAKLVERRRKFIDGLDANRGEINLDIFEDFYPDRAHFVFELLQNAEDAGATEVIFALTGDGLTCEHNGRPFTLDDVISITGLHDSTKAQSKDKIGKFGVGFKSVFVYTSAPSIYSGDFAFEISHLILPEPIPRDRALGPRTRFEFPFDNPRKPPNDAFAEVAAGLSELDEKTLLFLTGLQAIEWRIEGASSGRASRHQYSDFHFEVLKESEGKVTSQSHFLRFSEAVSGLENQQVAIAFPLDLLPGVRRLDEHKSLADQCKIIPAEPGSVAVFFPAVKETSGLRFHLHGPFVPELSRASIKETAANIPLFEQLARLAAQSLHRIQALGLLTADFLSVLPNLQDQVAPRYQRIRTAIVDEMKSQPLTPTYERAHAPANSLIQARASLKVLLSDEDIALLVPNTAGSLSWAIGATQRNSRIDNFLTALAIREWGLNEFIAILRANTRQDDGVIAVAPDPAFLKWLSDKPPAWMQEFYALLHTEAKDSLARLTSICIVRLANGDLSRPDRAYFSSESTGPDMPVVDRSVFTSGASRAQQDAAKKCLVELGVREIGEIEEIEIILRRRYTREAEIPDEATYFADLKRFVALVAEDPDASDLFEGYYIFHAEDDKWRTPKSVYIDRPYIDSDLTAYYGAIEGEEVPHRLHPRYMECSIESEALGKFCKSVGCVTALRVEESNCVDNPQWQHLSAVGGSRATSYVNRDYYVPLLSELLTEPSIELSRLIWRTLSALPSYPNYLHATYQLSRSNGAHTADSRLVHDLRESAWVPQGDGLFVRPADASRELLPSGFQFDPGYTWIKAIQFGETAASVSAQAMRKDEAARSLGFEDAAEAERARRFTDFSVEEQQRVLIELERREKAALPDRPLTNPERRAQRVREQALAAPDKESEIRERSVSIGREAVKEQADAYLREHYRNADGEVTCQICKGPLPFKLDDGTEYFEVVEFLPELRKRHPQNYIALCPNHSAMFRIVNRSKDAIRESFVALTENELPVLLSDQELSVYFSKTHIVDLKAVIDAEDALPPAEGG